MRLHLGSVMLFCILSVALPTHVLASAAAGFAPGSLWLSKTEAAAGETLKIFTVLYDSTDNAIEGDLVFIVDDDDLNTQHFKLDPGETQILSEPWVAIAGTHTFSAMIKNLSGISDNTSTVQSNTVKVVVLESAPSPIVQYTNVLNTLIASSSPAVQSAAQTVIDTTENWRQTGADWLSEALYSDQATTPASQARPEVLGTSTTNLISTPDAQKSSFLGSIWRYILMTLLYIFTIQWLFYLALLAVIYIIYKIIRAIFSERRL